MSAIAYYYVYISHCTGEVRMEKHYNDLPKSRRKGKRGPYFDHKTAKHVFDHMCAKNPNKLAIAIVGEEIKPKKKKAGNIQKEKQENKKISAIRQTEYVEHLFKSTVNDEVLWSELKSQSSKIMVEQSFACTYHNIDCLFNILIINKDDHINQYLELICNGKTYEANNKIKIELYKAIVNQYKRKAKTQNLKTFIRKKV